MATSFRHMILLFYAGAIAFIAMVASVAIYLHARQDREASVIQTPAETLPDQLLTLQSAAPSSAAFALFAQSPAAAFGAWGTCSKRLLGEDAAATWLATTFGDGQTLSSVLARYAVSTDAPMAVFLELAPVDRQFQTRFAVVLECADPEGFIKSAWPIDPSASSSPRLLAERNGYTLALHGTLVCASWPDYIAVSNSMDFASDVAETFRIEGSRFNAGVLGEQTAVAFLYPGRLQSVWTPLKAWLRVTWPPVSSRLASACDVLDPAKEDPGPVLLTTRVMDDGLSIHATWSARDCPRLAVLLGDPPPGTFELAPPNAEAIVAGCVGLTGLVGDLGRSQLWYLAKATHDADTVDAVTRITDLMSERAVFEFGPFDGERSRARIAWNSSDCDNSANALASILPVVSGAESSAADGTVIRAARVLEPLYFAASQGLVVVATDANDVRELLSAPRESGTRAHGARRLSLYVRGAHLAQAIGQSSLSSSLDRSHGAFLALSRMAEGDLSWDAIDSSESIALRIQFAQSR